MENQKISLNNIVEGEKFSLTTRIIEGDTYPISDNESITDSMYIVDSNTVKLEENHQSQDTMSQDSLTNGEPNHNIMNRNEPISTSNSKCSSKTKTTNNGFRSLALDEHIRLVKQKKEEAEILRLQRFQEQLRIKEQKWQQQQLERVKKWLQLRNRDCDHRLQVEERRKKREEEAKVKIEEILRREKEREQNYQQRANYNHKLNVQHKSDTVMSMSTDVVSCRRTNSATRSRTNQQDMTNRQVANGSSNENPTLVISTHQLNPIDEQHSSANKPMPTSYTYWLNTGDNKNATFMRSTFSAKCRSFLSRSAERCPRVCRVRDENLHNESQRRTQNLNRQHLNETIRRLAKPRNVQMTQSIHVTTNGFPMSRSSHQIRPTSSNIRKNISSRPATVPTSTNESRTSPADECSTTKKVTNRSTINSKYRSKPSTQRSFMVTSQSSTTLKSKSINQNPSISTENQQEIKPVNDDFPSEITETDQSINIENTIDPEQQQLIDEQEYQRKLNQKIREAQQRLEIERQREEERKRQLEFEEYEREQEQIRLAEEQRRIEQERLQRAIEERQRENELKRQEEQRLQQQREEFERKQAEETERLNRERQERAKKEEEERNERKKRLDLIMRRTRQTSPNSKQENNTIKPIVINQTTNIPSPTTMMKSSLPHSISETQFPTSPSTPDTPKFKSPLIQSLLNKARNTRSTDNLIQTSLTSSQIMTESLIDETKLEENVHQELHLSSSTNLNSYHDRPMETATVVQ